MCRMGAVTSPSGSSFMALPSVRPAALMDHRQARVLSHRAPGARWYQEAQCLADESPHRAGSRGKDAGYPAPQLLLPSAHKHMTLPELPPPAHVSLPPSHVTAQSLAELLSSLNSTTSLITPDPGARCIMWTRGSQITARDVVASDGRVRVRVIYGRGMAPRERAPHGARGGGRGGETRELLSLQQAASEAISALPLPRESDGQNGIGT
ncbi:hypothetical protein AAFF_G00202550 [Aldrovandia affinis]|uniref:Uncharacterized protein n=1 Tax=Aldrovandia affinis TaxID=143900 RepID=A0AAD7SWV7_9TELE|nr:hypothetical protein AAFF_G00202550 [Aldrovandia affinis]